MYNESSIKSTRMEEAKEAAKILGINNVKTLGVSCQQVDFNSQKLFGSLRNLGIKSNNLELFDNVLNPIWNNENHE